MKAQHLLRKQGARQRDDMLQVVVMAGLAGISVLAVAGIVLLIAVKGLEHFWPDDVVSLQYLDPQWGETRSVLGEVREKSRVPISQLNLDEDEDAEYLGKLREADEDGIFRWVIKVGNREILDADFEQLLEPLILGQVQTPAEAMTVERVQWGNFYGYPIGYLDGERRVVADGQQVLAWAQEKLSESLERRAAIKEIEKSDMGGINASLESLRLELRSAQLKGGISEALRKSVEERREGLLEAYDGFSADISRLRIQERGIGALLMLTSEDEEVEMPLSGVIRFYQPNSLDTLGKAGVFLARIWEFVSAEPREANTEGGVFPAIFGTIMLVLIMTVFVMPFGVIAAIYLSEYAKQGTIVRLVRISVSNLAGVPSIVFGVVGLGFFVYVLGENIDELFFPERLPSPTFGSPGILWSALTLAILTLPVVIVATEEGLRRVPSEQRFGALALGATKSEMLIKVVLPAALPSMLTGMILAISRAAGEVAPLMLVGVVKYAPLLPVDSVFPYAHLDRTFMHLGFHIFDVGFQSPNSEAARPVVFATALLLLVIILILNIGAILLRNRWREQQRLLGR